MKIVSRTSLLLGFAFAALLLLPSATLGQERDIRRTQRSTPHGSPHTSGSVGQPTARPAESGRDRIRDQDRARDRNAVITRPAPAVIPNRPTQLPERSATVITRPVRRPVTVIQRPITPARPVYRPVTVIQRPITRPVYRPIRWGTTVVRLPERYVSVQIGGVSFFVSDGVYYTRGVRPSEYVVVRPPIGARVTHIPSDAIMVEVDRRAYYFYDDVWYDEQLVVVEPPYGGFIYQLPEEHEEIHYGDERYYRVGQAIYQPSWRDGRSVFVRVEINF